MQNQLEKQLIYAQKSNHLCLNNLSLSKLPEQIFLNPKYLSLKVIDIGFNQLESIPSEIKIFQNLEILLINDNPLQYLPLELSECQNLKILNLNNTYIKYLQNQMVKLENLSILQMENCPLRGKLAKGYFLYNQAYPSGIFEVKKYLQRKFDRIYYKKIITERLKQWMYQQNSIQEIQQVMNDVFNNMKDLQTKDLKRLLRNFQSIFPKRLENNPELIRQKLLHSNVKKNE